MKYFQFIYKIYHFLTPVPESMEIALYFIPEYAKINAESGILLYKKRVR